MHYAERWTHHLIVVHGSALDHVPASYVHYLERSFLEGLDAGTPVKNQ